MSLESSATRGWADRKFAVFPRMSGHRRAVMLADVKDLVRLLRRIAVTVAGTVILAVGVVLLVAPGPGLVVIALALAVFALEYRGQCVRRP
jgi:hypothetical protein